MVDAGGPRSVRKCPGVALAELDDVEDFQLSDGVYKRKKFIQSDSLKFEELSDVDISHAVSRRLPSLAFTGSKWVAFVDPIQQTGWLIDLQISSPFIVTGKNIILKKVVNRDTRLCSYIPETRNIVVSEAPDQSYVLKAGKDKRGSLKIVSEFPPAGIIGLGLSVSTILLEIVLGDRPDAWLEAQVATKLANQVVGIHVIVQETSRVQFTLQDIQHETDFRLLDLDKLFIDPVSLKRLQFTSGKLSSDQTAVIIGQ